LPENTPEDQLPCDCDHQPLVDESLIQRLSWDLLVTVSSHCSGGSLACEPIPMAVAGPSLGEFRAFHTPLGELLSTRLRC
jgi:hypothetical protein